MGKKGSTGRKQAARGNPVRYYERKRKQAFEQKIGEIRAKNGYKTPEERLVAAIFGEQI